MPLLKVNSTNTQYGCYSTIIFTLKMEYVTKITIVSLKMTVEGGSRKIFLKFIHATNYFSLLYKWEDVCLKVQIQ